MVTGIILLGFICVYIGVIQSYYVGYKDGYNKAYQDAADDFMERYLNPKNNKDTL